jgi:FKBP-type peptidyl-prolyl cis-trans isomerase FklB
MLVTLFFMACNQPPRPSNVKLKSYADSLSYTLGFLYGLEIPEIPITLNHRIFYQGLINAKQRHFDVLDEDELLDVLERFEDIMIAMSNRDQEMMLIINQSEGRRFMEDNAKKPEVQTTVSGLQYRVLRSGSGRLVRAYDDVTVHYTGRFLNGEIFDSSRNRFEPMSINVSHVIDGWSEGLQLMRVGDVFEFVIPDSLAYGERGYDIVEPGAYLIFEVEVISID